MVLFTRSPLYFRRALLWCACRLDSSRLDTFHSNSKSARTAQQLGLADVAQFLSMNLAEEENAVSAVDPAASKRVPKTCRRARCALGYRRAVEVGMTG
jgi:hypothetical protein